MKKVTGWLTADGRFFKTEFEAHEAELLDKLVKAVTKVSSSAEWVDPKRIKLVVANDPQAFKDYADLVIEGP